MYHLLHTLLSDKKGGEIFTLFGAWHFAYLILTAAVIATILAIYRSKGSQEKQNITKVFIRIAFGLYIADFFLMPLAYGEIDIEKLPFHACTAMCVMCFLSDHLTCLKKYRLSFVLLGFISNLVYLIYPAGVMWHAVHPFSYRVIQTLLFHSTMTVYGCLTLLYEHDHVSIKGCTRDLTVLAAMTAWALLGNAVYNGASAEYSHFFNWFFVVRDPFYLLPEAIAPLIMPFLNVALFFAVELLLHLILWRAKWAQK